MKWPRNVSAILDVEIDKTGKLISARIIPVILKNRGIPYFDTKGYAISIINKLIKQDFPESKLFIDKNGNIVIEDN